MYMRFATRIHCCHLAPPADMAFDGLGGVLAHTEYPRYGGDLHVDDDENWALHFDPRNASGHGLGLEHSCDPESIMFPNTGGYNHNYSLNHNDIHAIRLLYG
ncbi:unnamed protein product, partial [Medioppia subpectinata]